MKLFFKAIVFAEKQLLEVEPVFAASWLNFRGLGPKTNDANTTELDKYESKHKGIWTNV